MDEYVTKDTLKETLIDWSCNASYIEVETKWALEEIKNIPAADVAPIKHGYWKPDKYGGTYCSICNLSPDDLRVDDANDWGRWDPFPPYCPNCGAKMN